MNAHKLATLVFASLAAIGCGVSDADIANGEDPLRALTVPHRSERYTTTYWTQRSVRDTTQWRKAIEYCKERDEGDHPNCDAVRYVEMIERRSRLPEDRPDSFRLTVPQATVRDTTLR